jgi:hypothetical protein
MAQLELGKLLEQVRTGLADPSPLIRLEVQRDTS